MGKFIREAKKEAKNYSGGILAYHYWLGNVSQNSDQPREKGYVSYKTERLINEKARDLKLNGNQKDGYIIGNSKDNKLRDVFFQIIRNLDFQLADEFSTQATLHYRVPPFFRNTNFDRRGAEAQWVKLRAFYGIDRYGQPLDSANKSNYCKYLELQDYIFNKHTGLLTKQKDAFQNAILSAEFLDDLEKLKKRSLNTTNA